MGAPAAKTVRFRAGYTYMFPKRSGPKTRQKRSEGNPKEIHVGFRAPEDLAAYLKGVNELGYSNTEAVLRMLYLARDVVEEMGPDWWEMEARANREGITPGQALARFAAAGLKAKK